MEEERDIEIHIPHQLGYERVPMESAGAIAAMMGFNMDRINDLKTAVSEACINAIEHGSVGASSERILVTLSPGNSELRVDVQNWGGAFNSNDERPDIGEKMEGRSPTRGWGMFLIRSLVDKVQFSSQGGKNTTNMVIYLDK